MSDGKRPKDDRFSLTGQLVLAMPGMEDPRFDRTVIYMCSHSKDGAMGFVLNQKVASPTFVEILRELKLEADAERLESNEEIVPVFRGGPVEQGRGFVIHSLDYGSKTTSRIGDFAAITATQDVLRALSNERRPAHSIMLLGYAGWGAGQLEEEIARNGWLTLPATQQLVFHTPHDRLYSQALSSMGVSEELLSGQAGHA